MKTVPLCALKFLTVEIHFQGDETYCLDPSTHSPNNTFVDDSRLVGPGADTTTAESGGTLRQTVLRVAYFPLRISKRKLFHINYAILREKSLKLLL